MGKIKVAIAGVGNCASSLVQGVYYYKNRNPDNDDITGLMHWEINGYKPSDIKFVSAFDIDSRKVGKNLSDAIYSEPNCTTQFYNVPKIDMNVKMGRILDGFAEHMVEYDEKYRFVISGEEELTMQQVVDELKNSEAEILLNYLPVGSEEGTRFYAECALNAGIGFINCIPVFIASDEEWAKKFKYRGLPIIGDDIKSQLGATIVHRTLTDLFRRRGVKLERTYQLNTGGNTDFLNMLERKRLKSKKLSKTEAVQSVAAQRLDDENIHIGPSDYVPWQKDNKVCFIRMEGKLFGNVPMNLELRLSVEDSPNSAGVVIDAIRCCKLALDRGISGPLHAPSSYFMKHPPKQHPDPRAYKLTEDFINQGQEKQIPIIGE